MPNLNDAKRMLGYSGNTIGNVHKNNSDMIMDATWDTDINSKIGYFYDQFHDDEFEIRDDLHPEHTSKIPIPVKHFELEYSSLSKDTVGWHLQFKPNDPIDIPYYDKMFGEPYKAHKPIGMYVDLSDNDGIFHRWLVVAEYRERGNQFPTYIVLPCDHKLQWVYKGKKMECWCVTRSQNSYNSGVWLDFKIQSPENQKITWLPMNDITSTIFYDQRCVISQPRQVPVTWICTKVEDMNVKGIARYTWAQDRWNEHTDVIERDADNAVVGMWADLLKNPDNTPQYPIDTFNSYAEITYTGTKPQIKVNGSYKTLTVTFYNSGEELKNQTPGEWTYTIDDVDATELIEVLTPDNSTVLEENQIKIKFLGGDEYIDKTLVVTNTRNDVTAKIRLSIVGL